jgi:hypothetical protein
VIRRNEEEIFTLYAHSLKQTALPLLLNRLKISTYELYVLPIIGIAIGLRILLVSLGWPPTNSDEGTMGLMARHIAYNGEHPIYFYGYNYMGALEAYLGAGSFRLFGSSVFTLRLGVILLDTLFLVSMYLLTRLLYTKGFALGVLVVLSLGSNAIFLRELYVTGGSTQTLLFGCLAFLLATWLALTSSRELSLRRRWQRFAAYGAWGMVVGLGLWSDLVVLPYFMMAGLLLLVFCWRDLRSLAPLCLLVGLVIGAFPLIMYNLHVSPGQDLFSTFVGLFHGTAVQAPRQLAQYLQGIKATLAVSLPTATGDPFCPAPAVNYAVDGSPKSIPCNIIHTVWSLGYLLLWTLSVLLTARALWKLRPALKGRSFEEKQVIIVHVARLFLLAAAGAAIAGYAVSSAPLGMPYSHARYLVGLLIVTPAILWPLWSGANHGGRWSLAQGATERRSTAAWGKTVACRALLLLVAVLLLIGVANTFSDIPSAQAANQQQEELMVNLQRIGATHIYTDYWTCDRLALVSQEKIICGVLDDNLQPTHNRYAPYYSLVKADPHTAYVFTYDLFQKTSLVQKAHLSSSDFRRFVFDGYIVYQPR